MILVLEGVFRGLAAQPQNAHLSTATSRSAARRSRLKCCIKKDRVAAREDRTLNPKITGTLQACFLSSVVSGLPLCPAVFRLGLMSVQWEGCITAVPS